jgi:hypothetical protein
MAIPGTAGPRVGLFVVAAGAAGYIWDMSKVSHSRRIVLGDHVRLPGRFFGRLTASIQAEL